MSDDNKPYYAVIFTSLRTPGADDDYDEMAEKMFALARQQPGFLGVDSAHNDISITISYWESPEAIKNWKQHADHLVAQRKGRFEWYKWYKVRICKVEREYGFDSHDSGVTPKKL